MTHQITPHDCPGPSNPAQAMNIDRFSMFDAQVDLVQDSRHVAFVGTDRSLMGNWSNVTGIRIFAAMDSINQRRGQTDVLVSPFHQVPSG